MKILKINEVELSKILLYNIVEVNGKKYIALLIDGAPKDEKFIIEYTKSNENAIVAGMKQINEVTKEEIIYEDGKIVKAPSSRLTLAKQIYKKQRDLEKAWDSLTDEEKNSIEKNTGKKGKKALLTVLVCGALGLTALGTWLGFKHGSKNATPAPTTTTTLETPTSTPKVKEEIEVVIRTDRDYNFDINNDLERESMSKKLYNDVISKKMSLLTSGEYVKWDMTMATSVLEMLNGIEPSILNGMSESAKESEISKIKTAFYLISSEMTNGLNSNTLKLSDYMADTKEASVFEETYSQILQIANKAKTEPINGKIIDEDTEFSEKYINMIDKLLHHEIDLKNDPTYREMNASTRWILMTLVDTANNAYVPQWSHVERVSQPTMRDNSYLYRYYQDDVTKQLWIAVEGPNATVIFAKVKCRNENGTIAYDEYFTLDEMVAYDEANVNVHELGIKREVVEDEIKIANEEFTTNYLTTYTK